MFFTSTPTSSRTSRATVCSTVSPGSTKPASVLYIPFGNCGDRARSTSSARCTRTMAAGFNRGKYSAPHFGHTLENRSVSRPRSVLLPQRPQKRCITFQVMTCVARPAITKNLSSRPPNRLRKSWKEKPAGSSPSTSAAKHLLPSRTPISSSKSMSSPSDAGFPASLAGPSPSRTSIRSPMNANHSSEANSSSPVEERGQILGGMQGPPLCAIEDLLAATRPRGDDDPLSGPPHRGEEPSLPHLHRNLVVSLLVAEEPGHPATS